jgi:hypothetical protein
MIYVLEDEDADQRALWTVYAQRCIQWRVMTLERMYSIYPPPAEKQKERVRALEARITGHPLRTDQETRDHWTDALLLWQRQPADVRDVVVKSVGAKLSTVPEHLGLVDIPRRFVFLPRTACVLANVVADVARDASIIWMFRFGYLGKNRPQTLEAFSWDVAASSLAALLNRPEHLSEEGRRDSSWLSKRICKEPDIPDLELVPSWQYITRSGS